MQLARDWSVADAGDIISQVIETVRAFPVTAKQLAVRGADSLAAVCKDVGTRLKSIGT